MNTAATGRLHPVCRKNAGWGERRPQEFLRKGKARRRRYGEGARSESEREILPDHSVGAERAYLVPRRRARSFLRSHDPRRLLFCLMFNATFRNLVVTRPIYFASGPALSLYNPPVC